MCSFNRGRLISLIRQALILILLICRADPEVKLSVEVEKYVTNYYNASGPESETAYKKIIRNPNIERIEKAKTVGMVVGHILTLGTTD